MLKGGAPSGTVHLIWLLGGAPLPLFTRGPCDPPVLTCQKLKVPVAPDVSKLTAQSPASLAIGSSTISEFTSEGTLIWNVVVGLDFPLKLQVRLAVPAVTVIVGGGSAMEPILGRIEAAEVSKSDTPSKL